MAGKNKGKGSLGRRGYASFLEEKTKLNEEKREKAELKKEKSSKKKKVKKSVAEKAKNLWNND